MSLDSEVVIVSGLPRSGTSLMMQMLDRGGIPALTDEIRAADADNPRGYFEFERVKKTKQDASWLPEARGRTVKMVSSLLYDLPDTESYRILFMERDTEEMLDSQERMLRRLDRPAAPREAIRASFRVHLARLFNWLDHQDHMQVLTVSYNQLMSTPHAEVQRIREFLDERPEADAMLHAIDPSLYRNRNEIE